MGTQIILTIPDELYSRARRIAQVNHQEVTALLIEALAESPILDEESYENGDHEDDEAVDREMTAYVAMHPILWEQYPGQYVAVYEGRLIDHDTNDIALSQRINENYPDVFVWMCKVEAQPFRTLQMPSFRLVK